ncbi:MAG: phosphoribosylanthranilate isomerase, partial [Pseudomonadota bacterium]
LTAAALGVDAIGLVFYAKSPRYVEIEQAASICRQLPAFVTTVALFMDAEPAQVNEVINQVRVDLLQFHGTEDPAYCSQFARPYFKALGMGGDGSSTLIETSREYSDARGVLLDSHMQGAAGGSGETFDWAQLPQLDKPVILAGGLNVDNVADAIRQVQPYAVDVSSGVESDKGIKSAELMSAFMQEVLNANR